MIGIYLSPRYEVSPNRTRNVLAQLVTYPESFEEIVNAQRGTGICYVTAAQTTHDAIAVDGRATLLTPLYVDNAAVEAGVDVTQSLTVAVKTKLEEGGINAAIFTGTHTIRDVIRFAVKTYFVTQILIGNGHGDVVEWLNRVLTSQVRDVPVATRTKVRNWLTSKGLDDSWINLNTTVREVLTYIVNNLGWSTINAFGKLF